MNAHCFHCPSFSQCLACRNSDAKDAEIKELKAANEALKHDAASWQLMKGAWRQMLDEHAGYVTLTVLAAHAEQDRLMRHERAEVARLLRALEGIIQEEKVRC